MWWIVLILSTSLQLVCSQDPVNGGWSEWSTTAICNVECGQGLTERVRTCDNPEPQFGGSDCTGSAVRPGAICNIPCGCDLEPCANNGSCVQNETDLKDYNCTCAGDFFGQNCTECGADIRLTGEIAVNLTSVGYPNNYPDNIHCTWTISADPGSNIQLTFNEFDVDQAIVNNCSTDYTENIRNHTAYDFFSEEDILRYCPCIYDLLIVYTGQGTNATELDTFCNGNQPTNTIRIESHQLSLVFHTDPGVVGQNRPGFHITARALPVTPCSNHVCKNGATCEILGTDYQCQCPQGYSGTFCETDSPASHAVPHFWVILLSGFIVLYTVEARLCL